jgi:hypothetical protein
MRYSFSRINKFLCCILKIEFVEKLLEEIVLRTQKKRAKDAFIKLCLLFKNQPQAKWNANISKNIILPSCLKSATIKVNLVENPLFLGETTKPEMPVKIASLYPPPHERENIDFCDTITLFMSAEVKSSSIAESKFIESCRSPSESKKSLSPRSYIKMLSEVEFTAVPHSNLEKRRTTDLISSVDKCTS